MTDEMTNVFTVDAGELHNEINELKELTKASSEKSGDLGARKTAISERKGYHKAALNTVLKIDSMSETNRADFLRTFQPMFEAMYPTWVDDDMLDMLDGLDEEAETDPDGNPPSDTAPEEAPMEAEATTDEGLEDFNGGDNVESLHGDVA